MFSTWAGAPSSRLNAGFPGARCYYVVVVVQAMEGLFVGLPDIPS